MIDLKKDRDKRIAAMLRSAQSRTYDKWSIGGLIKDKRHDRKPPKITLAKVTEWSTADAD